MCTICPLNERLPAPFGGFTSDGAANGDTMWGSRRFNTIAIITECSKSLFMVLFCFVYKTNIFFLNFI